MPAGAAQEVGPGGVVVPVVVEVEAVEDGQAGVGSVDLGNGDSPVHLDDRGAGLTGERSVQGGNLPPVAGLVQEEVRDGRLEQVGAGAPARGGLLQQGAALVDLPGVPQAAVLVVEADDLPVAQPGGLAGVVQQHQRQQRQYFRLIRHQASQCPAEVDRFGREVDPAAAPALVEDQVDHSEDGRGPFGQLVTGRHGERDARIPDFVLGPGQPLAHGLERDEERQRDLLGRQAAEGAQGQCYLRLGGERGVTAGEDQLQPLVRDGGGVVHGGLRWLWPGFEVAGEQRRLRGQDLSAAQLVDGAVAGGGDQPAGGVGGFPVPGPAFGGGGECLGGRFFGQFDVAEDAGQSGQHAAPLVAEDGVKRHGSVRRGPAAPRWRCQAWSVRAGPRRWRGPRRGCRPRPGTGRRGTPCCR